uniref:Uncharacterized protein n=1 Tax=Romanomermis culicivorax TaxID=13658 RepID=A0A915HVV3_ROMCU
MPLPAPNFTQTALPSADITLDEDDIPIQILEDITSDEDEMIADEDLENITSEEAEEEETHLIIIIIIILGMKKELF